jgi:hypothetical protein
MHTNFSRILSLSALLFLIIIINCFSQENNTEDKHEIVIGTGYNIFGSFFQKSSLGIGINVFIFEHPSSKYDNNFIFNNGITFEYIQKGVNFDGTNGDFYKGIERILDIKNLQYNGTQLRIFSHINYLLLFEMGISGSIYFTKNKDILYGIAPEIAFGIPPLHFFPISPSITYRYNIYNLDMRSKSNYHEFSLSIKGFLPFRNKNWK